METVEPAEVDGPSSPAAEDTCEYVTFEMAGEGYALEMARVQEIIRLPELVRMPLGPQALEGLANLRGRVLPVVSLRRCCGLPTGEHGESTRVVVVEAGGAVLGFVVDRVAAVVAVEPADVEPATAVQSTLRSDLLQAVLRGRDGRMTTVLDVERLVGAEFRALAAAAARGAAGAGGWTPTAASGEEDAEDTLELVSFAVEGQEYALPIDRVQEIVQAPERVVPVPNAPARVLGVMDLRGRLLPVLSLRSAFGLPVTPLAPQNRIVVVTLDHDGAETLVGVVMDTVREVLRVPLELVGPLPHVVAGGRRRSEVEAVCRLEGGRRLVSVLDADVLIDADQLRAVTDGAGGTSQEEEAVVVAEDGRGDDELLVVFRLAEEEYCVDVDAVQEIIRVPDALVRVPRTLDFVEGLVNLRGSVLPVVDLRTRLGLDRVARDERHRIVVLIIGGVRTGFVVDSVAEVARVASGALEPAPELSAEQARLVARVANLAEQQRMLMILEPDELLRPEQVAALAEAVPAQEAA